MRKPKYIDSGIMYYTPSSIRLGPDAEINTLLAWRGPRHCQNIDRVPADGYAVKE